MVEFSELKGINRNKYKALGYNVLASSDDSALAYIKGNSIIICCTSTKVLKIEKTSNVEIYSIRVNQYKHSDNWEGLRVECEEVNVYSLVACGPYMNIPGDMDLEVVTDKENRVAIATRALCNGYGREDFRIIDIAVNGNWVYFCKLFSGVSVNIDQNDAIHCFYNTATDELWIGEKPMYNTAMGYTYSWMVETSPEWQIYLEDIKRRHIDDGSDDIYDFTYGSYIDKKAHITEANMTFGVCTMKVRKGNDLDKGQQSILRIS